MNWPDARAGNLLADNEPGALMAPGFPTDKRRMMMKKQMRLARIYVLLTLILATLPVAVFAGGEPQLQLEADKSKVKVGEEVAVTVLVKGAPLIYGADVRVTFDPAMLEVVDADSDLEGIQVKSGKFLDPDHGFVLQHQVDNTTGTIDYALTLLNPAPPAEGNGVLVKIAFRAKGEGETTISVAEGLFGAQTGETISPALGSVAVRITAKGNGQSNESRDLPVLQMFTEDRDGAEERQGAFRLLDGLIVAGLVTLPLATLIGIGLKYGWSRLGNRRR
ncbi:MAG: hypothetical protein JXR84_19765 [Anaerolineae bacterium]|nr:hypothetical protein [Anaerolineae bacterium]